MRLRLIYHGDFRKNELTLYNEALKKHKGLKLGTEDCILFLSGTGKILRFVYGFIDQAVIGAHGKETGNMTKVLETTVYRITGAGKWNPLMLRNYAEEAGVELVGLRKFEDHYRKRV